MLFSNSNITRAENDHLGWFLINTGEYFRSFVNSLHAMWFLEGINYAMRVYQFILILYLIYICIIFKQKSDFIFSCNVSLV